MQHRLVECAKNADVKFEAIVTLPSWWVCASTEVRARRNLVIDNTRVQVEEGSGLPHVPALLDLYLMEGELEACEHEWQVATGLQDLAAHGT